MPFGSPGNDVQPQAMLQVFLNRVVFGMTPQAAIEQPRFASSSFPSSSDPHNSYARSHDSRTPVSTTTPPRHSTGSGHGVNWWRDWEYKAGCVCAVVKDTATGMLEGGADVPPPRRGAGLVANRMVRRTRKPKVITDLGGDFGLAKIGAARFDLRDPYHIAVSLSWPAFVAALLLLWLAINLFFASLYILDPGGVANARPGSFSDVFFFSVETLATVGYGRHGADDAVLPCRFGGGDRQRHRLHRDLSRACCSSAFPAPGPGSSSPTTRSSRCITASRP